jgi:3'-phosphoadenosine 5'-phosphosulfate sulfotransferase (PAPS reductase)/FAD synthetase
MGSALRREDLIRATLAAHLRRVDASLDAIRRAAEIGPIGVCYSGGKDSTVTLDLVRRVVPDAPAAFFDSGCELDSTLAMVAHVGAVTIHPRITMLDMARYAGWWGYKHPVDPGCPFDAKRIVIEEPSEAFVVRHRLRVVAHGIRGEESGARGKHTRARGELYEGADRTWYVMPIARWSLEDVWAYIASRELRYNRAYDDMSDARIARDGQRVATLLGDRGSGWGRHAMLRRYAPDRWRDLVAEFPGLALFS